MPKTPKIIPIPYLRQNASDIVKSSMHQKNLYSKPNVADGCSNGQHGRV